MVNSQQKCYSDALRHEFEVSYDKMQSIFKPAYAQSDTSTDQAQKASFTFFGQPAAAVNQNIGFGKQAQTSNTIIGKRSGPTRTEIAQRIPETDLVLKPNERGLCLGLLFYRNESEEQAQELWIKCRHQLTRDFKNKNKQAGKRKRQPNGANSRKKGSTGKR